MREASVGMTWDAGGWWRMRGASDFGHSMLCPYWGKGNGEKNEVVIRAK